AGNAAPGSRANGLDLEPWAGFACCSEAGDARLAAGLATPQQVDDHVRRVLRTLFAYGFCDRAAFKNDDSQIDKQAHADTAEQVEESAITMLENRGALPLGSGGSLKSIAVIGKDANGFITGGGSGNVVPFSFVTPLEAIKKRVGPGVSVTYDDGSNASSAAALAARS